MKNLLRSFTGLFCAVLLILSGLLSGCSSTSGSSSIQLQEGVTFELMDVLKIKDETSNSIYYYYLAGIENTSDEVYSVKNLSYHISDETGGQTQLINPIDTYQSVISSDLKPDMSTMVYGYIGFPNSNEKNVGLAFDKQDTFLPFSSVKGREIKTEDVVNSLETKFVIYEDEFFSFEVDASKVKYEYADGISTVSGLIITYTNKSDQMLVVPYLSPVCSMAALKISELKNPDEIKKMSLSELKKQDFSVKGLAPKTTSSNGTALGYQLYYLMPDQSVPCNISFTFNGLIPDFNSPASYGGVSIHINSAALGYRQVIKVPLD